MSTPSPLSKRSHAAGESSTIVQFSDAPHSLNALIGALSESHAGRRLVLLLGLRYTGGADQHQQANLAGALRGIGQLLWLPPLNFRTYSEQPFDQERLAGDLDEAGVPQLRLPSIDYTPSALDEVTEDGDVVVISLGPGHAGLVGQVADLLRKKHLGE